MALTIAARFDGFGASYGPLMTIGGSLFLIAVGAILNFAVTADVSGIDLQTVGVILMVIGVVGLVLGLVLYGRARRVVATRGPNDPLI